MYHSVIVTGIQTERKTNTPGCPEGSIFDILNNGKQQNVLLPENNLSVGIPDFYILPNCSYKIQVIANPRKRSSVNPTEVSFLLTPCTNINAIAI